MVEVVGGVQRPESPDQARRIIERIQQRERTEWQETPEAAREELQGLREVTAETLDNPTHVLPELLQNADDIGKECSSVSIRLTENALVFQNHGGPMTVANVEALGAFTKSTKKGDLNSIGHFGIGFKSVFSLTDTPLIHSGYFSFQYSADEPTMPSLVPYEDQTATEWRYFDGTTVTLPFTVDAKANRRSILVEQLLSIESLLPFLNNITSVNVSLFGINETYHRDQVDGGAAIEVRREYDGTCIRSERLRLFSKTFTPDAELLTQIAEKRNLRAEALHEQNPTIEVTIAIPIDKTGAPTARARSHLFCYFPTEPNTHLPFDIQADFSLKPDRKHISWPDTYNEHLLRHVPAVFEAAFIQFHAEQVEPSRVLEMVPDPTQDRTETPYLDELVEEIAAFVRTESCIPDQAGNLFQPSEVVFLPPSFRDIFWPTEVSQLLDRPVHYPSTEISQAARDRIRAIVPESDIDVETFLDACTDASMFTGRNVKWSIRLFAGITRYWNATYAGRLAWLDRDEKAARKSFVTQIKSIPFLPLETGSVSSYTAVGGQLYRLAAGDTEDYDIFTREDSLTLLSNDLVSALDDPDDDLHEEASRAEDMLFGKDLFGIADLGPRDIVREVINPAFESDSLSPAQADQFVLFVAKRPNTLAALAEIKLQVASTAETAPVYRSPDTLYLGQAYIDAYDSERLFSVFDDLDPVSDHYRDLGGLSETDWRAALARLGVKQRIDVIDQDPWESDRHISEAQFRTVLDHYGDDGATDIHDEELLDGYNGQSDKWGWMKRVDRRGSIMNYKYALIDHFLAEETRTILENLTEQSSDAVHAYWTEFLRMLDTWWDEYYRSKVYREYHYSQRTSAKYQVFEGDCYCPSSFGAFLREQAWAPASTGHVSQPQNLFVRNDLTAGKPISFIEPEPADSLIEFLGVQRTPGIQVTISTLHEFITQHRDGATDEDPATIERSIRSQLFAIDSQADAPDEEDSDLPATLERLAQMPFIFIPDAEPAFRTPSQVTWTGPRLGDYLTPVGEKYRDFESLFETLGVKHEPSVEDFIAFLGEQQPANADEQSTDRSWTDIETAWRNVLQATVYLPTEHHNDSDDSLDAAITALRQQGRVPTAAETLVDPDDVRFWSTNTTLLSTLPTVIQEQTVYPWRDQRYKADVFTERFAQLTGTTPLDESLDRELTTDLSDDDFAGAVATTHPHLLNVAYSYLLSTDNETKVARLEELAAFALHRVDVISCAYSIDQKPITTSVDLRCFVDTDRGQIVLSEDDRADFALIDALVQELDLAQSQLVSLLKGAVGKPEPLLRAFLADSDFEYRRFSIDVESIHEPGSPVGNADDSLSDQEPIASDENVNHRETQGDRAPTSDDQSATDGASNTASTPSKSRQRNTSDATGSDPPRNDLGTKQNDADVTDRSSVTEASNTSRRPVSASRSPRQHHDDRDTEEALPSKPTASDEQPVDAATGDSPTVPDRTSGGPDSSARSSAERGHSGGGWGISDDDKKEIGDRGEAFIFEELQTSVEQYFERYGRFIGTELSNSPRMATIRGEYEGRERTVFVADVSTEDRGYDILLKGAALAKSCSSLALTEIGENEQALLEVKASKTDTIHQFTLTFNEYRNAIRNPNTYVITRVHNALSDDASLHRLFHSIPDLGDYAFDVEYQPSGLQIRYEAD